MSVIAKKIKREFGLTIETEDIELAKPIWDEWDRWYGHFSSSLSYSGIDESDYFYKELAKIEGLPEDEYNRRYDELDQECDDMIEAYDKNLEVIGTYMCEYFKGRFENLRPQDSVKSDSMRIADVIDTVEEEFSHTITIKEIELAKIVLKEWNKWFEYYVASGAAKDMTNENDLMSIEMYVRNYFKYRFITRINGRLC